MGRNTWVLVLATLVCLLFQSVPVVASFSDDTLFIAVRAQRLFGSPGDLVEIWVEVATDGELAVADEVDVIVLGSGREIDTTMEERGRYQGSFQILPDDIENDLVTYEATVSLAGDEAILAGSIFVGGVTQDHWELDVFTEGIHRTSHTTPGEMVSFRVEARHYNLFFYPGTLRDPPLLSLRLVDEEGSSHPYTTRTAGPGVVMVDFLIPTDLTSDTLFHLEAVLDGPDLALQAARWEENDVVTATYHVGAIRIIGELVSYSAPEAQIEVWVSNLSGTAVQAPIDLNWTDMSDQPRSQTLSSNASGRARFVLDSVAAGELLAVTGEVRAFVNQTFQFGFQTPGPSNRSGLQVRVVDDSAASCHGVYRLDIELDGVSLTLADVDIYVYDVNTDLGSLQMREMVATLHLQTDSVGHVVVNLSAFTREQLLVVVDHTTTTISNTSADGVLHLQSNVIVPATPMAFPDGLSFDAEQQDHHNRSLGLVPSGGPCVAGGLCNIDLTYPAATGLIWAEWVPGVVTETDIIHPADSQISGLDDSRIHLDGLPGSTAWEFQIPELLPNDVITVRLISIETNLEALYQEYEVLGPRVPYLVHSNYIQINTSAGVVFRQAGLEQLQLSGTSTVEVGEEIVLRLTNANQPIIGADVRLLTAGCASQTNLSDTDGVASFISSEMGTYVVWVEESGHYDAFWTVDVMNPTEMDPGMEDEDPATGGGRSEITPATVRVWVGLVGGVILLVLLLTAVFSLRPAFQGGPPDLDALLAFIEAE